MWLFVSQSKLKTYITQPVQSTYGCHKYQPSAEHGEENNPLEQLV
jgi:hypothetical protein